MGCVLLCLFLENAISHQKLLAFPRSSTEVLSGEPGISECPTVRKLQTDSLPAGMSPILDSQQVQVFLV